MAAPRLKPGCVCPFLSGLKTTEPCRAQRTGSCPVGTVTQAGAGSGSGGVWLLAHGGRTDVCHCSPGLAGQGRDANPPQKWHLWASHLWKDVSLVGSWGFWTLRRGWPTWLAPAPQSGLFPGREALRNPLLVSTWDPLRHSRATPKWEHPRWAPPPGSARWGRGGQAAPGFPVCGVRTPSI